MMTDSDFQKLKARLIKLLQLNSIEPDLVDLDHLIDSNITVDENYTIIKNMYNLLEKDELLKNGQIAQNKADHDAWDRVKKRDGLNVFGKHIPLFSLIIGSRGSGKTALSHLIIDRLRQETKRPIYLFRYPREDLLKSIGYHNIKEIGAVEHLSNCILYLDEPQITLPRGDHKGNDLLFELLTICRHRDITLVVSTSDTRWVNKGLESYVDITFIKDIEYEFIKNGAMAKKIIRMNSALSPEDFKLEKNEYLMYFRKDAEYQGKFENVLPSYWNEGYSKPFGINSPQNPPEIPQRKKGE